MQLLSIGLYVIYLLQQLPALRITCCDTVCKHCPCLPSKQANNLFARLAGDSTGLAGYAAGTKGVKHEAEQDLNMELAWLEADCERRSVGGYISDGI